MSAAILTLFLSMGATPGEVYVYRGTVIADKGDPVNTKKTFELSVMVHGPAANPKLLWTVSESGRGAWPWTARFGKASLDPRWQMVGAQLPAVLYKHEGGNSAVKLLSPLYKAPKKLRAGSSWKSGKLEYKVVDSRKVADRKVWRIHVGNGYGRKRTMLIDQKEPLVVAMRETVFIGQGQQHELQMRLVKSSKLKTPKEVAAVVGAFEKLDQLRTKAKLQVRKPRLNLNKGQLTLLRKDLPAVAEMAKKSFLAPIVLAATKETRVQRGRSGAIAELRRQAIGKKFTQLTFTSLRNKQVSIKVN